ncbi:hypothetical protein AAY81_03400 [Denitrobacterium detoxificans]|nr:hypothetical protein AAY81_03400 [Denitrobacterium detoxificans]
MLNRHSPLLPPPGRARRIAERGRLPPGAGKAPASTGRRGARCARCGCGASVWRRASARAPHGSCPWAKPFTDRCAGSPPRGCGRRGAPRTPA